MYLCLFLSLKRGTDQSTINNDGREIENLTTSCACGFMLWRCRLLFQRNYTVITRLSSPLTVQCPLLSYKHQYCLLDIFHTFLIDLILKISCQSDVVHAPVYIHFFLLIWTFCLKLYFYCDEEILFALSLEWKVDSQLSPATNFSYLSCSPLKVQWQYTSSSLQTALLEINVL